MKIKSIETFTNQFVGFVRVTTDDGREGFGQVSPYHVDITALVLHRQAAPWSLGRDADDIEGLIAVIPERQPFDGDDVHHASAGRDTEHRQVPRAVDRRAGLLPLAGGAVPQCPLSRRGRAGDDPERAWLWHRGRADYRISVRD